MFKAVADGFGYLFGQLNNLFSWLLTNLSKLLQPLLDFMGGIFYFVYMLGVVIVKVVMLVIGVARLLLGLIAGLFKTITGLSYTGAPALLPTSYTTTFAKIRPIMDMLQLDKVAYVFLFAIWIYTAWAAMQKIRNMGGGGSS